MAASAMRSTAKWWRKYMVDQHMSATCTAMPAEPGGPPYRATKSAQHTAAAAYSDGIAPNTTVPRRNPSVYRCVPSTSSTRTRPAAFPGKE